MTDTTQNSEDLFENNCPDDVTSLFGAIGYNNIKVAGFIFILFIVAVSDVFVERILYSKDNEYVIGRSPTHKGVLVQGMVVSLGYLVIYVLIECGYL